MSHEDPTDLSAQDSAIADKAKARENDALTEKSDLQWLMSSPRGRRIVWRILGWAGLYRLSFTGNSETFFREGERNIGLKLQAKVAKASPQDHATMMLEHFAHD